MTAAWTSGYVGDVTYTLGFYRELAPSFLNFVCADVGVEGLPVARKIRYAELGCGRGYGTALLAASNPDVDFVGIDFNPSHIAEARTFAKRAGIANVTFLETSFGDAARSHDPKLAELDVIALHGVYTWVERKIRDDIHEFIRSKLVPGGLAFVSYNTLPGWAPVIPVQRILMEIAERSSGDSIARINKGKETLKVLADNASGFVVQNPALKTRLAKLGEQDNHYLVHEFLNTGWEPLFVTDTMAGLAEAKLTYVGSASIGENRLDMCVPKGLRDLVRAAPDTEMRELLKDYVLNKQFRRDIYVKGPQRLSQRDQRQRLAELSFGLVYTGKDVPEKLRIPIGEVTPKKELVEAILSGLKDKPATGADLMNEAAKAGAQFDNAWVLLEMLVHNGLISPACLNSVKIDRAASRRLNDTVMELTLSADTHRFLASPVLGSAVGASFIDRVVAPLAAKDTKSDDINIAGQAFDRLNGVGQHFLRQGRPMERNDENLREVARLVREFRDQRLPRWRALQIVG